MAHSYGDPLVLADGVSEFGDDFDAHDLGEDDPASGAAAAAADGGGGGGGGNGGGGAVVRRAAPVVAGPADAGMVALRNALLQASRATGVRFAALSPALHGKVSLVICCYPDGTCEVRR